MTERSQIATTLLHQRWEFARDMKYISDIIDAARTTIEGLSITASHLLRRPITVQYPDRTPKPVKEMLPERYRGFLDVDLGLCTGCTLCMQACPIQCIRIEFMKRESAPPREGEKAPPPQRLISRFDIDIGLCMFCGLCTEPCPTNAIHFSREFERATPDLDDLTFKFIKGEPVVPYKPRIQKPEAGGQKQEGA